MMTAAISSTDIEAELIEGVGHFLMLEKPAEINGRILQFLSKA